LPGTFRDGALKRTALDNGLVMRAVGDTMIVAPPLVISRAEVDELVAIAGRVLDRTAGALARDG